MEKRFIMEIKNTRCCLTPKGCGFTVGLRHGDIGGVGGQVVVAGVVQNERVISCAIADASQLLSEIAKKISLN